MLLRSSTRNFRVFGALGALFLFSTSSPVTAQPSNAVQSFVQENIDKGYALLNNDALSEAQRNNQFRGFMLSLMDTRRVGRFTLGPYANSASPADLAACFMWCTVSARGLFRACFRGKARSRPRNSKPA